MTKPRTTMTKSAPIIIRERVSLGMLLKVAAWVALLLFGAFTMGYLWPRPERGAVILQAVPEVLPAGVMQLYPRDPNWIVRWIDGAGVGRDTLVVALLILRLRRMMESAGRHQPSAAPKGGGGG